MNRNPQTRVVRHTHHAAVATSHAARGCHRGLALVVTLALMIPLTILAQQKPDGSWGRYGEQGKEWLRKSEIQVPARPVTSGPKHHWFGYYDKYQTDPSDRYVLAMEVGFEHRSPKPDDEIKVGMVDLEDGGKWIELGSTRAWNWQQGCMLQWRPSHPDEVLWNDRENGRFVCRVLNIKTKKQRTIPSPVFTLSPDGKFALSLDFERIQDVRAGYGYAGAADRNRDVLAPADAGIYRVSLEDGGKELVVPFKEIAAIPYPLGDLSSYKHYFEALEMSPDGRRFAFLHRWVKPGEAARVSPLGTRFLTTSVTGGKVHVLNDSTMTSHFWWKNPGQLLAWANRPEVGNRFFLFEDKAEKSHSIVGDGMLTTDGHCSFLKNKAWILTDTYPDRNHQITLYLFNTETRQKIILGKFFLDPSYTGEWRVDLHPRQSRDGKHVLVDCALGRDGRQILMLDISGLALGF